MKTLLAAVIISAAILASQAGATTGETFAQWRACAITHHRNVWVSPYLTPDGKHILTSKPTGAAQPAGVVVAEACFWPAP